MAFKEYSLEEWSYNGQSALCLYDDSMPMAYPYDPDDWCRCCQVLTKMFGQDELKKRRHILRVAKYRNSEVWKRIGDNYYFLQATFMSEWDDCEAPRTYELLKELEKGDLKLEKGNLYK